MTDDNNCTYEANIAVSGISGTPTYTWNSGASGTSINDIGAGVYTLSVTDGSCTGVRQFEVEKVLPESFPVCMVTVDDSIGKNIVVWEKAYKSEISHFELYRESWQAGAFLRVFESHVDTLSQWVDLVANPQIKAWSYKMITTDVCGAHSEFSATHKTMHLVMQRDTSGPIELNWNAYGGLQHSLYYIERLTDTTTGWLTIDSVSAPLTTYIDANPPKQNDLLYAIAFDHPGGGCTTSRAAPKKYGAVRSSRSINGGENPTIGVEPPDTTSVRNIELPEWGVLLYPNPSNGQFTVAINGELEDTEIEIWDLSGRRVFSKTMSSGTQNINLKDLGAGMYLVSFSRNEETKTERLVIN